MYDLIIELFDYFVNHLDEVPAEYKVCHDFDHPEIQVVDYVSSMTDRYAMQESVRRSSSASFLG